jgi:hypothetical protein
MSVASHVQLEPPVHQTMDFQQAQQHDTYVPLVSMIHTNQRSRALQSVHTVQTPVITLSEVPAGVKPASFTTLPCRHTGLPMQLTTCQSHSREGTLQCSNLIGFPLQQCKTRNTCQYKVHTARIASTTLLPHTGAPLHCHASATLCNNTGVPLQTSARVTKHDQALHQRDLLSSSVLASHSTAKCQPKLQHTGHQ